MKKIMSQLHFFLFTLAFLSCNKEDTNKDDLEQAKKTEDYTYEGTFFGIGNNFKQKLVVTKDKIIYSEGSQRLGSGDIEEINDTLYIDFNVDCIFLENYLVADRSCSWKAIYVRHSFIPVSSKRRVPFVSFIREGKKGFGIDELEEQGK